MSLTVQTPVATIDISEDDTTSTEVVCPEAYTGSIDFPTMTGATVTILRQLTATGSFVSLVDNDGNAIALTVASGGTSLPDACFPCHALKFVSDASEAADRSLQCRFM